MKKTMTASSKRFNTPNTDINNFRKNILTWYDKNQREMPWRAVHPQKPNPYHVWLSEIMLQQTTVATVGAYFKKFISIWPTVEDLANAERDHVMQEWAGLGYYARARNLHKCAQEVVKKFDGILPQDEATLQSLPGIGAYTSASVRAIAFDNEANVVDGNIERIMARLYAIKEPMPKSKKELKRLASILTEGQEERPGDYAQALMDIGATVCTPTSPKCNICPVKQYCLGQSLEIQEILPIKKKKGLKPQRIGEVYWVLNDKKEVLIERRNEKEMLGGMVGFPTSEWIKEGFTKNQSDNAIYHTFTHFDLKLDVISVQHEKGFKMPEKEHFWTPILELDNLGLPTLFKKVVKLMK